MTGFYIKCNNELKWVNIAENLLKNKKSVIDLSQTDIKYSPFTVAAVHSTLNIYRSKYLPDFTSAALRFFISIKSNT